ncbi:GAF and ANTAR domain-containing protein [Cellulomonas fengjieae]|uniref:GAF and ANTAR domain-containing protein n=1 Tax=Cellulomonas fengjieae TaxID=2819978 RepID=A0ABS3SJC4_9CELL|nr:GAF and ANTAR domain-containing protein [Cellulomonas fengjieae]MBO3085757.1 GAF and ANTAR domain-containing protein [Cellulomonas fengjieae]
MSDRIMALAQLARVIASAPAEEPLPVRLCRAYVEVLGADGGAITLSSTTSQRLTLSTSDGVSAQIEDLQDVLGEGPGQDAYRSGQAVVTKVDGLGGRLFPVFSGLASSLTGPLTVWAIPMQPGEATLGVITVYRGTGELSYSLEDAQFLADSVGAALLDDPSAHGATPFAGWSNRARVHQATGMIVAHGGFTPEDALVILRAHAFAESTSLDRIASDVIEQRLGFTPWQTGGTTPTAPWDDGPKDHGP